MQMVDGATVFVTDYYVASNKAAFTIAAESFRSYWQGGFPTAHLQVSLEGKFYALRTKKNVLWAINGYTRDVISGGVYSGVNQSPQFLQSTQADTVPASKTGRDKFLIGDKKPRHRKKKRR
jgi:hypothetical protein